jgi:hypothetical protein
VDKFWEIFGHIWGFLICCVIVAMIPGLVHVLAEVLIGAGHTLIRIYNWFENLAAAVQIVSGFVLVVLVYIQLINRRNKS